jgi:hypothetical protein
MANYRLYCFDGGGRVWVTEWLEAASDEEALRVVRGMDTGVKYELWDGRRLVTTVDRRRTAAPVYGLYASQSRMVTAG